MITGKRITLRHCRVWAPSNTPKFSFKIEINNLLQSKFVSVSFSLNWIKTLYENEFEGYFESATFTDDKARTETSTKKSLLLHSMFYRIGWIKLSFEGKNRHNFAETFIIPLGPFAPRPFVVSHIAVPERRSISTTPIWGWKSSLESWFNSLL